MSADTPPTRDPHQAILRAAAARTVETTASGPAASGADPDVGATVPTPQTAAEPVGTPVLVDRDQDIWHPVGEQWSIRGITVPYRSREYVEALYAPVREMRLVDPAELDRLVAERDRYREHSVTLNTVGWRIAHMMGDVPDGTGHIRANPVELVDRLAERDRDAGEHIASLAKERDAARRETADVCEELARFCDAADAARAEIGRLRAEVARMADDLADRESTLAILAAEIATNDEREQELKKIRREVIAGGQAAALEWAVEQLDPAHVGGTRIPPARLLDIAAEVRAGTRTIPPVAEEVDRD